MLGEEERDFLFLTARSELKYIDLLLNLFSATE